jgi:hypothetical protein
VELAEFAEFVGYQWRCGGDAMETKWRHSRDAIETVRDSWRLVEISRDTFEIQMPKPK